MKALPIYIIMSLVSAMPPAAIAQAPCLISLQQNHCETKNINLYVGPQSVQPGENIFIAIETLTGSLESSSAEFVTIIDADSGRQYKTKVDQGLAFLEIKAPSQTGRLVFIATENDVKSMTAEVLVHAGKASAFNLLIEKNKGEVFLSSSLIADGFGNILDDGMTVDIDLVSGQNVYSSRQTRTQNGRFGLHIGCEAFQHPDTRIRARIGEVSVELKLPAYMCGVA